MDKLASLAVTPARQIADPLSGELRASTDAELLALWKSLGPDPAAQSLASAPKPETDEGGP